MSAELKFYTDVANSAGEQAPKFVRARVRQLEELIDSLYGACGELEAADLATAKMPMELERGKAVYDKVCPSMT